jgi:phosphatidylserine/phosphatidylglycerophosphate/cardiolipin synthase-like enzyme
MNINKIFSSTGSHPDIEGFKVLFDGIEDEICQQINDCDIVLGCSFGLNNKKIVDALKNKGDGVCIILDKKTASNNINYYKYLNSQLTHYDFSPSSLKDLFTFVPLKVTPSTNKHAIRIFGLSIEPYDEISNNKTVKRFPIFHHKFLIFCHKNSNDELTPKSVFTGSYNFTENANYSRENGILLENSDLARAYLTEWEKCVLFSESCERYSKSDINPEFISESSFSELKEVNDEDNDRLEHEAGLAEYLHDVKIGVYDNEFDQ